MYDSRLYYIMWAEFMVLYMTVDNSKLIKPFNARAPYGALRTDCTFRLKNNNLPLS